MKKIAMKNGKPEFILDTEDLNYSKYVGLLMKNNGFRIYDVKDVNDVTFYYNCNAYFDYDGRYKTKDGRSFRLEYNLGVINEPNCPINKEVYRHTYDGKDGINFTLPTNIYFNEIVKISMDSLSRLYPEEKIVEPEYIYAIYSCIADDNGNKIMSLPYYTKDINAAQELIYLDNKFHELFSNEKEKESWYELSEINIETNKHDAEFIKSTAKEITLEDVKNIKPRIMAYITTCNPDKYDKKLFSPMYNKTLYISLYTIQPKIDEIKLNDVEQIDSSGFLHIYKSFTVDLEENVEKHKQLIYKIMINKAVKLLSKTHHYSEHDNYIRLYHEFMSRDF